MLYELIGENETSTFHICMDGRGSLLMAQCDMILYLVVSGNGGGGENYSKAVVVLCAGGGNIILYVMAKYFFGL